MKDYKITWSKDAPQGGEIDGFNWIMSEPWMVSEVLGAGGTILTGWCFRNTYQKSC